MPLRSASSRANASPHTRAHASASAPVRAERVIVLAVVVGTGRFGGGRFGGGGGGGVRASVISRASRVVSWRE